MLRTAPGETGLPVKFERLSYLLPGCVPMSRRGAAWCNVGPTLNAD